MRLTESWVCQPPPGFARIAADGEIRIFVPQPPVDTQCGTQRAANVDVDLAALLLDVGVLDREVALDLAAVRSDDEQLGLVVKRVEGAFGADFDREFRQILAGPRHATDGLVPLRLLGLLEPAVLDAAVVDQAVTLNVGVEVVALAPGCESDELDCPAGEGPSDVTAELEDRIVIVLDEAVVVRRAAGWRDSVSL